MDISHSTARGLAPLSFVVDFAAQNYGMLSSPNMKDVQDANLSFFSPQSSFIVGFFLPHGANLLGRLASQTMSRERGIQHQRPNRPGRYLHHG